jgi:16S rRNA (cytosine967-C5)-methyltransferase
LTVSGASVEPHQILKDAFAVRTKVNLFSLETYRSGKFEIQDLASQCVSIVAAPKPGERWLEPCAGAGGKSLHLAQLMNRKGCVVAGDIREAKLEDLRRRARRAGFPNIQTRAHNGGVWKGRHLFDGVLVDAPCSCSGVWRRNPGAQWKLKPTDIDELSATQEQILGNYADALRENGVLVYATCSLFDAENSAVVRRFLDTHDEYKLDPFPHPLTGNIVPGMVRIDSVDGNCDALFIARMRKVK